MSHLDTIIYSDYDTFSVDFDALKEIIEEATAEVLTRTSEITKFSLKRLWTESYCPPRFSFSVSINDHDGPEIELHLDRDVD